MMYPCLMYVECDHKYVKQIEDTKKFIRENPHFTVLIHIKRQIQTMNI